MQELALREENLIQSIHVLRGEKVMLDFDLAMLYNTETRTLKQAVKRNIKRFPPDFMFKLNKVEWYELITNCDKLNNRKFSPSLPFAFTEQGVAMLSSVLKSERAIEVNISIMRTFVQLRKIANIHKEIFERLDKLDDNFESLKDLVRSLLIQETAPKKKIGFITE